MDIDRLSQVVPVARFYGIRALSSPYYRDLLDFLGKSCRVSSKARALSNCLVEAIRDAYVKPLETDARYPRLLKAVVRLVKDADRITGKSAGSAGSPFDEAAVLAALWKSTIPEYMEAHLGLSELMTPGPYTVASVLAECLVRARCDRRKQVGRGGTKMRGGLPHRAIAVAVLEALWSPEGDRTNQIFDRARARVKKRRQLKKK